MGWFKKKPTPLTIENSRYHRQLTIGTWAVTTFGSRQARNSKQRALRLLEEALELYQAVGGPKLTAHALIDHVFGRPVGEFKQEIGGVSVTLLALAAALDVDLDALELKEVKRVLEMPPEKLRIRNEQKNTAGFLLCKP